jgi:hypothetical protein
MGKNGITNMGISLFMLMKWLYIDPQKKKLIGVMIGAIAVVNAVSETDSTMLPFDSDERKFEMLPPGHDATNIIPSAIIGVMTGLKASATANVIAGRANHCNIAPVIMDLGFLKISLIVRGLMPRATPNITNARMIFTIIMPPSPKFMVTELRDSNCSFMVFRFYGLRANQTK